MDRSNSLIRGMGQFLGRLGADRPRPSTRARSARRFSPTGLEVMETRVVLSTTVVGVTPIPGVPFVPPGHADLAENFKGGPGVISLEADGTEICATIDMVAGQSYVLAIYASPSRNGDNLTAQTLLATAVHTADEGGLREICIDLATLKNIPGQHHVQGDVFTLRPDQLTADGQLTKETLRDLHKVGSGSTPAWVTEQFLTGRLFDVTFEHGPKKDAKK